ncbi:glycosyl transferase family 2 [Agromyces ramosus]|uniref:Glycosyl transferase family 2 n=1 Tax=Agromyces ramosus TaxID=33879 RepID=A0A4Q7MJR3_9MICO|nr:glycosyltransferase [Agromyces ramosus]RZS68484.1 glycosyl transferase family 2 [Agromyces ramosus]
MLSVDPIPFTLLISVYHGDSPRFFADAFTSAVVGQTRMPAEVVLVQDGPIAEDLAAAISAAIATSPVAVTHVVLQHNAGLATALTVGLAHASHDVIARMDADDVALPERFERQLPLIESGYDLVGTGMYEFDHEGRILGTRVPPVGRASIAAAARLRDPFNHPTVVYRSSAVQRAGGYRDLALMEDYLLFARMIQVGARVANLAEPLVMYRVDAGAYNRRGGWRLFASEVRLQRELHSGGFTTGYEHVRNVMVRGLYRFVPTVIRRPLYRLVFVRSVTLEEEQNVVIGNMGDEVVAS